MVTGSIGVKVYYHKKKQWYLIHTIKEGYYLVMKYLRFGMTAEEIRQQQMDQLRTGFVNGAFISVQCSESYTEELETIQNDLERIINDEHPKRQILIGCDFNSQIGRNVRVETPNRGKFGVLTTNIQGENLLNWLIENELLCVNSLLFKTIEEQKSKTIVGVRWFHNRRQRSS